MARNQIRDLISAIQELVKPAGKFPRPPASPAGSTLDWRARVDVPRDWTRPPPPEGILPADENRVAIEQDDEVTIEIDDGSGDPIPLPEPPTSSGAAVFDTLAYYLPFHFYQNDWGIYIKHREF
jgi:hypothetical protein